MTKAQQTITTCKHEETVKVLIEEFLQQHDDEFFHDFNFNGLKRWISSLLDKADGNKIAVEKPLHNLMQELKKIHAFSCDGIRIEDMHRTHRSRANMQEKYEEAKKYLDKAAHALDLPEGYYYRYVKTEHRSFGDDYQSGNYKNVPCANYDLSKGRPPGDVPRFEGESYELFFHRVPPEFRPLTLYECEEREVTRSYGKSGGVAIGELPKTRFEAATIIAIAPYIPKHKDFPNPFKFIESLLNQCGLQIDNKRVRSVIGERERFRGPILASDHHVAGFFFDREDWLQSGQLLLSDDLKSISWTSVDGSENHLSTSGSGGSASAFELMRLAAILRSGEDDDDDF